MTSYSLSHLTDQVLLRDLSDILARDRTTTAELLAHVAEVDARRLYLQAGYPSMHAYCVDELRLSEDAAYKRIQAARAARRWPALFAAVAQGRLHLTAVNLLAPYLKAGNADDLIAMATHRRKPEIERGLAERFPRTEALPIVEAIPVAPMAGDSRLAPAQVEEPSADGPDLRPPHLAPAQVRPGTPKPKVAAIASERFLISVTVPKRTHDNLRYAQELLSHCIPSGDVAQVLDRALQALVRDLEKRKFAATKQPRPPRRTAGARTIPAHVRRAVWQRDEGRCTFVSEAGHRCRARRFLEFDHVDAVARGGRATIDRMRLRCRAHNQYTAEQTFGVEFMRHKRREAKETCAAREQAAAATARARVQEVIPWLRALGFRADEAKRAAQRCEGIPEASLEQRVRVALGRRGP